MDEELFVIRVPGEGVSSGDINRFTSKDVTSFYFTEPEIDFLMPFFYTLADRFHKDFIDYYENDVIEQEYLDETLAMTEQFVSKHEGCEFSCAMHRFLAAVKLAKKNDVWLFFDF